MDMNQKTCSDGLKVRNMAADGQYTKGPLGEFYIRDLFSS